MIKVTGLSKIYHEGQNRVVALSEVDLEIGQGEMVSIMGPSGSGKSTFMNILGCLDQPTAGEYQLNGEEVSGLSQRELARLRNQRLGFVFQSFHLLPRMTALENVALPLVYAGVSAAERCRLAKDTLVRVGLADRLGHRPKELSGGQQQRVAIARSLVNQPRLILADEPTGNLDSRSSEEIMALFQGMHQTGITVVLVTHEPDIAEFTERVVSFRDGKIVSDRPMTQKLISREGVA